MLFNGAYAVPVRRVCGKPNLDRRRR